MELFDQDKPEVTLPDTAQQEDRLQQHEMKLELLAKALVKCTQLLAQDAETTSMLTQGLGELANLVSTVVAEVWTLKGHPERAAETHRKRLDYIARLEEQGIPGTEMRRSPFTVEGNDDNLEA